MLIRIKAFHYSEIYKRMNFKLNRDAAVTGWRALIVHRIHAPRLLMLEPVCLIPPPSDSPDSRASYITVNYSVVSA